MWVLLVTVAVLWLFLWLPVRTEFHYGDAEMTLTLRYLFLRIKLLPQPEKPAEGSVPPKKSAQKKKEPKKQGKKKKSSLAPEEIFSIAGELIHGALPPVARFLRSVVVEKLRLAVSVGGEDAGAAAHGCGRWAGAVHTAYAVAQNLVTLRAPDISITPNYLGEQTFVEFTTTVKIRPIKVLAMAGTLLAVFLYHLLWRNQKPNRHKTAQAENAPGIQGNRKG